MGSNPGSCEAAEVAYVVLWTQKVQLDKDTRADSVFSDFLITGANGVEVFIRAGSVISGTQGGMASPQLKMKVGFNRQPGKLTSN